MLAADKLQLQSQLNQSAVSLKEKEFQLHHSNLMTVGTQAAVLAGLDVTMLIEFNPSPEVLVELPRGVFHGLEFLYYSMITAAFCANMMVVSQTTILSVMGAGLALRGPDGSMMVATDTLYDERKYLFGCFGMGLALTVASIMAAVWLLLHWPTALMTCGIGAWTCFLMYTNFRRVHAILLFDEKESVDIRDLLLWSSSQTKHSFGYSRANKTSRYSSRGASETYSNTGTSEDDDDDEDSSSNNNNGNHNHARRRNRKRVPKPIQMV